MKETPILQVNELTKRYGATTALEGVSVAFRRGEVHALVGENGAGKSTLSKIIAGAVQPTEGTLTIKGQTVTGLSPMQAKKLGISMVYQEFNLVPELPVYENLFIGKELRNGPVIRRTEMIRRSREIFETMGVTLNCESRIKDLSVAYCQLVEIAKALLDEAGIVDNDGDGWREWNGEKISLNAVCPNGWTDWQASMEVVAAAGKNIGVEITTLYPEYSVYQTVFVDPDQTEYAIFMWSPDASTPSNPWGRVNQFMGKDYVGIANNWSGNWGQYVNDEAEALIKKIPTTTDTAELKDLYTKLTEIYLTEVPSFSLMYRPSVFHCVNESVWTNFPAGDDGRNIPPADCTDGYGIAALYELELVG